MRGGSRLWARLMVTTLALSSLQVSDRTSARLVHATTGRVLDVSPDGRLAAIGQSNGVTDSVDLVVRDLDTGAERTLVKGSPDTGYLNDFLFSTDGSAVAYRLTVNDPQQSAGRRSSLWVVPTTGRGNPRKIREEFLVPVAWSNDGRSVLATGLTSLPWVSVSDGTARTVKVFEGWQELGADRRGLSPDGQWIAYSARHAADRRVTGGAAPLPLATTGSSSRRHCGSLIRPAASELRG